MHPIKLCLLKIVLYNPLALIINIDTATEYGSVCLSNNGIVLGYINSSEQKAHATFVHMAVEALLSESNKSLNDLNAVAITAGPGSYTGLRVSMASAKGFCYALSIPLIAVNTLKVMAYAALSQSNDLLCCPMIDARRMEVFTALYNRDLNELVQSGPVILDENFLIDYISENRIIFIGNGVAKYRAKYNHPNCIFIEIKSDATHLAKMAINYYKQHFFEDSTYFEPKYLKSIYLNKR